MPVTLADVAREPGVSKMTVSRATNDHPPINAEDGLIVASSLPPGKVNFYRRIVREGAKVEGEAPGDKQVVLHLAGHHAGAGRRVRGRGRRARRARQHLRRAGGTGPRRQAGGTDVYMKVTRRDFLKTASTAVAAGAVVNALPNAGPHAAAGDGGAPAPDSRRLLTEWEYRRGNLGGIWEAWRKAQDDTVMWKPVEMPHCFNAYDAVDPDAPYYQGPGWYRTRLKVRNPHAGGRTLLHFEGAGQKTEVYVSTALVGAHVGGYDEFTVDITGEAGRALEKAENKGLVPVAVMCDNSRDLEMIPSNLSDFALYGGLYRYVNLVYVPAVSLERVHVESSAPPAGRAKVSVRAPLQPRRA